MRLLIDKRRHWLTALHDAVMAGASFLLALYLRLGDEIRDHVGPLLPWYTLLCMLVCLCVFSRMRLYRGLWRYASMPDLLAIVRSATVGLLLFYICLFSLDRLTGMPRSVPLIQWLLLLALLGAPRFLYRMLRDRQLGLSTNLRAGERIPVLLIGAGERAELFLRDTRSGPSAQYLVVGIVDDNPARIGRTIHNVRIYGHLDNLPQVMEALARKGLKAQRAILTYEGLDGAKVRSLLDATEKLGIPLSRLPRLSEFKTGMQEKLEIRPIAVEDLLGRAQNVHDKAPVRAFIEGKVVLVTGAGGTIGSELSRQIASFSPAKLLLFESSEYALYNIDREIARLFPSVARVPILGDVRDSNHVSIVFEREKPQAVFHAAAIKHVPLGESNPEETVLTNVLGTQIIADACARFRALVMVLISTDKAVNPASVMGATKRAAENYCQALAQSPAAQGTRYVMVRFGNVLGSTGSVVPLFQEQLARGGPLTVTHADMVRYFMTVREAVELVLQASTLSKKNGELYVLDMGQPVRILDLAEQMIRLAGFKPHVDIKITFTGLREGEKMVEELFHFSEEHIKTAHESIWLARQQPLALDKLAKDFRTIGAACSKRDKAQVLTMLKQIVPEYHQPVTDIIPITRALLSVSDKTGLVEFARFLESRKVEILSTGGTAKALAAAGIKVREVSEHTGFPEMLDGRVKTLHPKIHGGILGRRHVPDHAKSMHEHGIAPIDLLVINLYSFEETQAKGGDWDACVENIDIGGPAMVRSAAKNHESVTVVIDPADYARVQEAITADSGTTLALRKALAAKAFARTASYDSAISAYFAHTLGEPFPERVTISGERKQLLRYGENPHQKAAFYANYNAPQGIATARQVQGKELSYNNINDTDAAFELVSEFIEPAVAIIKHANPCGVATGENLTAAYRKALSCDPVSAYGGIIAVNRPLDAALIEAIDKLFLEVIIAPGADKTAIQLLEKKKNLRLLLTDGMPDVARPGTVIKSVSGGFLLQDRDNAHVTQKDIKVVSKRAPSEAELRDMLFAFTVAKHVKSNAIVLARAEATIGIGAGQMSRVDSVRLSCWKAEEAKLSTQGCVLASDAFFPFDDNVHHAAKAGVVALIQPGGSIRDEDVIKAADQYNMAMVFTGVRHFRH